MKTAEQLAGDFCKSAGLRADGPVAAGLANILRDYARDQRHACAEAVSAVASESEMAGEAEEIVDAAHAACINAPFPGEGQ